MGPCRIRSAARPAWIRCENIACLFFIFKTCQELFFVVLLFFPGQGVDAWQAVSVSPAAEAEAPDGPVGSQTDRTVSLSTKDPRILIVDDVPVNVRVIQAMLRRLGVTDVIAAGNGAEALDILKHDPAIDIVLTDMWMPVLDGEGLIREIRSMEQWKDLPVYAVTADVETQKTYRDSGFTGILLKPITLAQLQNLIR